jgi:hypothetical protein
MHRGFATIGIIGGLVVGVIVLYVACFVWVFPYFHDQELQDFSRPLASVAPPEQTKEIDQLSQVGQQTGNSDHCDYLLAFLLKTTLPKQEIERYYTDRYKGKSQLNFFWIAEPHNPGIGAVNPTNISTLDEWVNITSKTSGANLIVYIFEAGMTSAFDYRCS